MGQPTITEVYTAKAMIITCEVTTLIEGISRKIPRVILGATLGVTFGLEGKFY